MSVARPIATTRSTAGVPTGRLAVWWVIASEIVIFGGILASYIMHRIARGAEWGDQAIHTNVWIGLFNTFVLLTSSYFAVTGHSYAERGDGRRAARYLVYTAGGGLLFVAVKSYEWTMEISHGYTLLSNTFWSFYYTAAGLHALHVIAGVVLLLIVAADARRGQELHRVELIGIYWHFVDVVWIFLFPLLYIAK